MTDKLSQCSDCLSILTNDYHTCKYSCVICEKDLFYKVIGGTTTYKKHIKVNDKNICEKCLSTLKKK